MIEPRTALESELVRLPEPPPPRDMADTVMARIARVDTARARAAVRSEEREASRERPRRTGWAERGPSFARGSLVAAGLGAAGLVGYVQGLVHGAWSFDALAPGIGEGFTALAAIPASPSAALGLAASMLLFLAGLLTPIGAHEPPTLTRSGS